MLSQIWQVWHRMEGVISFALAWSCEEFPSEPIVMEKCVGMWSNMWLATEVFENCAGMWSSMWLATEVLGNAFTEVCETKYQEFAFLNHFFIWSWFDFRLFTRMSVALMQLQRELCYLLLMGVLGKFISQVAWCFFQASIGSQVYMFSLVLIRIIVQVEYWYQPLIYVANSSAITLFDTFFNGRSSHYLSKWMSCSCFAISALLSEIILIYFILLYHGLVC